MIDDLIDSLSYAIKSCNDLLSRKQLLIDKDKELKQKVQEKQDYLQFIKGAKEKYTIAVNELYEESIGSLDRKSVV